MRQKKQLRKPESLGALTVRMQELAVTGRGRAALIEALARLMAQEDGAEFIR